jgi:hypothetical protein
MTSAPKGNLVTPVGFDPSGILLPLHTNVNGALLTDGESPSVYRPMPKSGAFDNTALPAGVSWQDAVIVPAGEYWRLTGTAVAYVGTVAGVSLYMYVFDSVTNLYYQSILTVVYAVYYPLTVNILLAPGWKVGCQVGGATLNDDLYIKYFAERVY